MEADKNRYQAYNYSDIFSEYFCRNSTISNYICPEHLLILIYSGELVVHYGNCTMCAGQGEYLFLCRDINIILEKKSLKGQPFRSTFIGLSRNFLNEFYHTINKKKILRNTGSFKQNVIEIPKNPHIESLYVSMLPFFQADANLLKELLEIKLKETVYCLLAVDKRFFSCLFGFIKSGKANLTNKDSCLYGTGFQPTGKYAGYVTQSYNKGISQISLLNPQNWILTKKLEATCLKLQDGDKITDIYLEVGYKIVHHMIKVYENRYGFLLLN